MKARVLAGAEAFSVCRVALDPVAWLIVGNLVPGIKATNIRNSNPYLTKKEKVLFEYMIRPIKWSINFVPNQVRIELFRSIFHLNLIQPRAKLFPEGEHDVRHILAGIHLDLKPMEVIIVEGAAPWSVPHLNAAWRPG